jgi:xanthine dehydrogenase accessory factor
MRGAGDLATGVALRLHRAGFRRLLLLETKSPLAVRRLAAFSEAVYRKTVMVEDVQARYLADQQDLETLWQAGEIPVAVDPDGESIRGLAPDVVIDAILAKRNTGTRQGDGMLVIGLGPGFTAGEDVHCVVETMRGHGLGRVIYKGCPLADTGIPGAIKGMTHQRLLRASRDGRFVTDLDIGDQVKANQVVATVDGEPVIAKISGVLRGLLRSETPVQAGTKLGDIDPRSDDSFCTTASDKALAIGGGVLEAILHRFL